MAGPSFTQLGFFFRLDGLELGALFYILSQYVNLLIDPLFPCDDTLHKLDFTCKINLPPPPPPPHTHKHIRLLWLLSVPRLWVRCYLFIVYCCSFCLKGVLLSTSFVMQYLILSTFGNHLAGE